ncbi:MAG: ShlB/FhaC/HecB family hemolysin secretion/activation protein [Parasphingorhabdus sp.]
MFIKTVFSAALTIGSVLLSTAVFQSGTAHAQAKITLDSDVISAEEEWVAMGKSYGGAAKNAVGQLLPQTANLQNPTPLTVNSNNSQQPNQDLFVGAIAISGTNQIANEVFAPVVEQNIGRNFDEEALRQLTQQIADMARDQGYIFATAYIPEQSLELGVLQLEVNEGQIDEVRIIGSENKALQRLLGSLEGRAAVQKDIERKLVLANDIPKLWVKKTRYLSENDRNILEVNVGERKHKAHVSVDNYGTDRHGPLRARLSFDFRGLLSSADHAGVSFRTNPTDPPEFVYASAFYSTAVGDNGTRVGASASVGTTKPGNTNFANLEGDSIYLSVYANHPLVRSDTASLWVNSSLSYLAIEQEDLNAILSQDKQVTFSLGLSSNIKIAGGRLRAGVALVQGLDILGTTRFGDFAASRFDGDGVFTKGSFYANWQGNLGKSWGLYVGGWGQIANKPLLASQEINIGGAYSARGFDFSELSGENGFSALLEINRKFKKPVSWIDKLQPYVFIDGGYVSNLRGGFGSGTLVSGGGGIRADIGKLNLEVETAVPLNRDRFETGNRSPQVNLQLGIEI